MDSSGERVGDGPRVKFALRRLGAPSQDRRALGEALLKALRGLEESGCCPVLDDGLAAGNAAVRTAEGTLLVSPSGRRPGHFDSEQVVELVSFDPERWEATYRSVDPEVRPTSDAALHWAALMEVPRFGALVPGASLHGHVLHTTRAARELGLVISEEATLFSTPPDRAALLALFERAPYPAHRTVIRRDHGFFTLGADLAEASATVEVLAERARAHDLLPRT